MIAALSIQQGREVTSSVLEKVVVGGDLSALSAADRLLYYREVCRSLGLNELTKPFDYIKLNGKLTLYALKTTTDQLRQIHGVSIVSTEKELLGEVYLVTAHARTSDGREDSDIGAVTVKGLQGENLANAYMKALTKAKRRVTLSICGLGWLDETEVGSIPTAQAAEVDVRTGEIKPVQQARTVDVTREVAHAAGVQPQTDRDSDPERLAQWRERLKATCETLSTKFETGKAAAIAELKNYPWETSVGACNAAYEGLKRIGVELKAAKEKADAQELIQPNQAAQPLDIDEPDEATVVLSADGLKALQTAYGNKLGLKTPEQRHDFATWMLTRSEQLASTKDLAEDEASFLTSTINGWNDEEVADQLAKFQMWQEARMPF